MGHLEPSYIATKEATEMNVINCHNIGIEPYEGRMDDYHRRHVKESKSRARSRLLRI
jgi:hypothetical protein